MVPGNITGCSISAILVDSCGICIRYVFDPMIQVLPRPCATHTSDKSCSLLFSLSFALLRGYFLPSIIVATFLTGGLLIVLFLLGLLEITILVESFNLEELH